MKKTEVVKIMYRGYREDPKPVAVRGFPVVSGIAMHRPMIGMNEKGEVRMAKVGWVITHMESGMSLAVVSARCSAEEVLGVAKDVLKSVDWTMTSDAILKIPKKRNTHRVLALKLKESLRELVKTKGGDSYYAVS